MNGLTIQIREEEKSFAKSHLAEVLNVSRSTISRWIEKGKIPRPSGHKGKFSRNNIEAIFRTLNFVPPRKFNTKGNRDSLNWLKKSGLTIERGGIFNAARLARYSEKEFSDMLDKPGLWDTQGWLNFQRMEDLVRNPIIQLTLAKELIDYWIKKVRELNPNQKVIIYWNGSVNSVVCIYLMPEGNEEFLREFDKRLKIKKCLIYEIAL